MNLAFWIGVGFATLIVIGLAIAGWCCHAGNDDN